MVAVPADTPVTTPAASTEATAASLLLHTPPAVVELNVVVPFIQTALVPVIAATTGKLFTVTVAVCDALQPLAFVTV